MNPQLKKQKISHSTLTNTFTLPKEIWSMILLIKYFNHCKDIMQYLEINRVDNTLIDCYGRVINRPITYYLSMNNNFRRMNSLDIINCLYYFDSFEEKEIDYIEKKVIKLALLNNNSPFIDEYYKLFGNLIRIFDCIFNQMYPRYHNEHGVNENQLLMYNLMIKYNVDLTKDGYIEHHKKLWRMALRCGKYLFVQLLISRNIRLNLNVGYAFKNMTPLHYACSSTFTFK